MHIMYIINSLQFDRHYLLKNGESITVDGDTSAILKSSRFQDDLMFKKAPCCAKTTQVCIKNASRDFLNIVTLC